MAIQKIAITEFLNLADNYTVLDVRSPGEYLHAHIPGAVNLPLFTDEERKIVGTAYKQQGKQAAIKIGLGFFGVRMKEMIETVEKILAGNVQEPKAPGFVNAPSTVLVHCWRGGMRSAGVAWLLDLYGFKVFTLAGGYKAYRAWCRMQFEYQYPFSIIGGYTGSGKTLLLQELKKRGQPVIDLEAIAHHKGSAFGGIGETAQPTQEMFENLLAKELFEVRNALPPASNTSSGTDSLSGELPEGNRLIYIEDESQRIGSINIPGMFWEQLRRSHVSFLTIPFEERLNYLTEAYGPLDKSDLLHAVVRIQKRLGGLETKNATQYLLDNNPKECFRILLWYYDKCYHKGLEARSLSSSINKIECSTIDLNYMINALINEKTTV